jgi:hypothetical protein
VNIHSSNGEEWIGHVTIHPSIQCSFR